MTLVINIGSDVGEVKSIVWVNIGKTGSIRNEFIIRDFAL